MIIEQMEPITGKAIYNIMEKRSRRMGRFLKRKYTVVKQGKAAGLLEQTVKFNNLQYLYLVIRKLEGFITSEKTPL
ncbi:MAG: hypothetical protein WD037_01570 [Balneolales bacterium]